MSRPISASSAEPAPARVAAFMLGAPASTPAALLALAFGSHAGMLTGAGHVMMRAATTIVLGGNGVEIQ